MKLFSWFSKSPADKGWIPGRAVAIPHYPSSENGSWVVENSSGANSISSLFVTLRPLATGEKADYVGGKYPRLEPSRVHRTTPTPEGCYRMQVNVPNWVHILVRQEGYVHKLHTEVPVWIDPKSGKIAEIDKDKLIEELMPEKDRAVHIFNVAGIHGLMPSE